VVVDTPAGPFLTKLRGAAHGTAALVAEVMVAEIAESIGLQVPARALIDFDETLASDDANDELADLLTRSHGTNLGFQFLPEARDLRPSDVPSIDLETAARIVWLDWFVMNPDRTSRNPNLLVSHGSVWLVDHGSSLGFQYNWPRVTEQSPSRPFSLATHVLLPLIGGLQDVHAAMRDVVTRDVLRAAIRTVPDDFLVSMSGASRSLTTLSHRREAYVAYLWKRLHRAQPSTEATSAPRATTHS
jgi:hypothetical protein